MQDSKYEKFTTKLKGKIKVAVLFIFFFLAVNTYAAVQEALVEATLTAKRLGFCRILFLCSNRLVTVYALIVDKIWLQILDP